MQECLPLREPTIPNINASTCKTKTAMFRNCIYLCKIIMLTVIFNNFELKKLSSTLGQTDIHFLPNAGFNHPAPEIAISEFSPKQSSIEVAQFIKCDLRISVTDTINTTKNIVYSCFASASSDCLLSVCQ